MAKQKKFAKVHNRSDPEHHRVRFDCLGITPTLSRILNIVRKEFPDVPDHELEVYVDSSCGIDISRKRET